MTVYVITKGNYSDYHICGVALDKEKAEFLEKVYSDSCESAFIEEYDTEHTMPKYVPAFTCHRDYETGNISHIDEFNSCSEYGTKDFMIDFEITNSGYPDCDYKITVKASTKEAAIKIASEKLAEYDVKIIMEATRTSDKLRERHKKALDALERLKTRT